MADKYHEIILNAVTGEITEVIRDWTPEELALQKEETTNDTK
jgi:hypothetical protein